MLNQVNVDQFIQFSRRYKQEPHHNAVLVRYKGKIFLKYCKLIRFQRPYFLQYIVIHICSKQKLAKNHAPFYNKIKRSSHYEQIFRHSQARGNRPL